QDRRNATRHGATLGPIALRIAELCRVKVCSTMGSPARHLVAALCPQESIAMWVRHWNWRSAALGLAFGLTTTPPASAHPHVWITVKSQIEFTPDGKVSAVIHDWVFDEMYSSFATQGLAPAGELVKKEQFAPLAKENAGSLAEIGYFTTLKNGGASMDFGTVSDYWMQERPDHLVEFHVTLPLKAPMPITKFLTLRVSDPEYFIDFEFD